MYEGDQVWCLPVYVKLNTDKVNTSSLSEQELFSVYGDSFLSQDSDYRFYKQSYGYKKLKDKQAQDKKEIFR